MLYISVKLSGFVVTIRIIFQIFLDESIHIPIELTPASKVIVLFLDQRLCIYNKRVFRFEIHFFDVLAVKLRASSICGEEMPKR